MFLYFLQAILNFYAQYVFKMLAFSCEDFSILRNFIFLLMTPNLRSSKKTWLLDVLLLLIYLCTLYYALGFARPLANPDEGRYSEIPREMLEYSDMVSPRLNGSLYFYKPPLFYWMQAVAIDVMGVNVFSARFSNSLMAIFGCLLTYFYARKIYGRVAGVSASLILATSVFYYAMGNIITLDMTLSVLIVGAVYMLGLAYSKSAGGAKGVYIVLSFVFMALALMTKGFIALVLPAGTAFWFIIFYGIKRSFKNFAFSDLAWGALGLGVFVAIALPWHIMAANATPALPTSEGFFSSNPTGQGWAWYYLVNEHFLRFTDASTAMREQPWHFFLVVFLCGLLPWTILLPQSLRSAFSGGWNNVKSNNPQAIYMLLWSLVVLAFFSISKSKLAPYILPIFPAMAVLIGAYVAKMWKDVRKYNVIIYSIIFAVLGLVLAVGVPLSFNILKANGTLERPCFFPFAAVSVGIIFALILIMFFTKKKNLKAAMFAILFGWSYILMMAMPIAGQIRGSSARDFAEIIRSQGSADDAVLIFKNYGDFQDLPFWVEKAVYVRGQVPHEQNFGYRLEEAKHKHRYLEELEDFQQLLKTKKVYIVLENNMIDDLKKESPVDIKLLKQDKEASLFVNRP